MRYIAAKAGDKTLYIEQEMLEAIVDNPSVYRVPGSAADIVGISYYKGELAVYRCPSMTGSTAVIGHRCGILIRISGRLTGVLAETAGEEERDSQELEELIQGVWVKKSDQA